MIARWYQGLPIAAKLRTLMTGACLVVILITGVSLMIAEWFIVRERLVTSLTGRAKVMTMNATAALVFHRADEAEELLRTATAEPGMSAAAIFTPEGAEFARFQRDASEPGIAPPSGVGSHYHLTRQSMTVWEPMRAVDGRLVGTLGLRMSLSILYQRLTIFCAVTLTIMLGVALLAVLLSHILQRILTERILELSRASEQITSTRDFSVRVATAHSDELGRLADAFNVMLGAVESSQAEARRLYAQLETHAKELERRVAERTAELQRTNREMEAFSYSVSHDLRAPLRSIIGFTQTLVENPENRLCTESVDHAQRIMAAATRMNRLIDGLLDLSRVSKRELRVEIVDLHALARDVVTELRPRADGRNVVVSIEPVTACLGDATLLRQVLFNLFSNAFKYSRERDPAVVTLTQGPFGPEGRHAYVLRDNGAGFDMKYASRLFQVFERLHDARRFEGTGIGLATSKRIVERHGGNLWAQSRVNEGATFYFTLPAIDGQLGANPALQAAGSPAA